MYTPAISNTTDNTGPFNVAAVATADVSSCSRFFNLGLEISTEKTGYKVL